MAYTKRYTISMIVTASLILLVFMACFALGFAKYAYNRGFDDGLFMYHQLDGASKYIKPPVKHHKNG